MTTQHLNYNSKMVPQATTKSEVIASTQTSYLERFYKYLVYHLTHGNEPRVWQEYSKSGDCWWCAYDPYTQRSVYCSTEDELRDWLEQLPYFTC